MTIKSNNVKDSTKPIVPFPFLKLSAELCNEIYALFLTADDGTQHNVTNTTPPSSALTFVSKQVHAESKGLFASACERFYNDHEFQLCISVLDSSDIIHALPTKLLDSVRNLKVIVSKTDAILPFSVHQPQHEDSHEFCFTSSRHYETGYPIWTITMDNGPDVDTQIKYCDYLKSSEGLQWVKFDLAYDEDDNLRMTRHRSFVHNLPSFVPPLGSDPKDRSHFWEEELNEEDMSVKDQLLYIFRQLELQEGKRPESSFALRAGRVD